MNTSGYQTLHGKFERAVSDGTGYCQMPETTVIGFISNFRVFIPPGARILALNIFEYGKQTAIARHKIPPTTRDIPEDYFAARGRSLKELTDLDQIISENKEGKIKILDDGIPLPYVTREQAGWLYVYVTGGGHSNTYYNKFQLGVDAGIFNSWLDSIDWDRDVEGVAVYGGGVSPSPSPWENPPAPQPTPIPQPTPQPIPSPVNGGPTVLNAGELGTFDWKNGMWVKR